MTATLNESIFRAYDIRGIVDEDLNPDIMHSIGKGVGTLVLRQQLNTLITARDGRLSGPTYSKALIEGILSTGCHVIDVGEVPTPLLYFATNTLEATSGVMLTASHNPAEYNGLKVVIDRKTLSKDGIHDLYTLVKKGDFAIGKGALRQMDLIPSYLDRVCRDVKLSRPLKVVLDCGNGIGGVVAPALYQQLSCTVHPLYCDVDGHFPNHEADPSVLKNLADLVQVVKEQKADIGIALDGDADRIGIVTNEGEIIMPDRLLMLLASDVLSRNLQAKVVYDVKSSLNLATVVKEHHGIPIMAQTGHSFIKNKMLETGALLAGELSGHVFFKERWYGFDDGIYTGARLLEILSKQNRSIAELFHQFPNSVNTPEIKIMIDDKEKFAFIDRAQKEAFFVDANIITIDGIRVEFKDGWGLLRASNTTPALILRFEANDEAALKRIQDLFKAMLLKLNPTLQLPF